MSSEEEFATFIDELPREKWSLGVIGKYLYQWDGYWYLDDVIKAAMAAQSKFMARDDDVILASSMKTGTTWLKALIPSIMTKIENDENDPLLTNHPNQLIPSLELDIFSPKTLNSKVQFDHEKINSPRLFRTHLPYSKLPMSVKNNSSKIVYITRDPKDVFASLYHFMSKMNVAWGADPLPINEQFEYFSGGIHVFGPFHDHVLEYLKQSLKNPKKILFLRYEAMKKDQRGQVKKLAEFLGRPFANEEQLDKVLWRCSFERLKNMEINKDGLEPTIGVPKSAYFRLGVVGDWENCLSKEMQERLDQITHEKFEGTDLDVLVM